MKNFNKNTLYNWDPKWFLWRLAIGLVCTIILALIFGSCDNFVEVDLPNSQLTAPTVFEDKATATAAMTDIYAKIRDAGMLTGSASGISLLMGNYADEFDYYGTSQSDALPFYNNTLVPSNGAVKELWSNSYYQIYAANAVIEGVTNATALATADRNQLKGEALFTRALLHFYLTNLYGAVPYITTTNYEQNKQVARTPVTAVYDKVKQDLQEAITLLPEDYITSDRTRPNRAAAHALLARVALYAGWWDEASNEASAVINNTALYTYETNLEATFLKECPATIWQLAPGYSGGNTLEALTFSFTVGPPAIAALSANLLNGFSPADQRKAHWIKAVTDGTTTWYHPYKYKEVNQGTSTEYSIMLRLGEIYLIRAEARTQAGDWIGAKEDLNVVRQAAGLPDTTALTQTDLLTAIAQERQWELFSELGHRFFDLKRTNQLQTVLPATKPGWDTNDALLPIPVSELTLNPHLLPQNTGY